jgi:hypothetical protein
MLLGGSHNAGKTRSYKVTFLRKNIKIVSTFVAGSYKLCSKYPISSRNNENLKATEVSLF